MDSGGRSIEVDGLRVLFPVPGVAPISKIKNSTTSLSSSGRVVLARIGAKCSAQEVGSANFNKTIDSLC